MAENQRQRQQIVKDDRGVPASAVLRDANGDKIDLTGVTVDFEMRVANTGAVKVAFSAAIPDGDQTANTGLVTYSWAALDVDTAGLFHAYFRRTVGGKFIHHPHDGPKYEIEIHDKA